MRVNCQKEFGCNFQTFWSEINGEKLICHPDLNSSLRCAHECCALCKNKCSPLMGDKANIFKIITKMILIKNKKIKL